MRLRLVLTLLLMFPKAVSCWPCRHFWPADFCVIPANTFDCPRAFMVSRLGYARVSTLDQNLALQQDALTSAGCEKIFTEQMSGAVADRPVLHEALDYARSGDTLVVWKLDRLARSMKQLIETIEKLRLRGIQFRSLTESIDTTTAQGLLVFHMFSALAEFERSLIRERTRAGLAAAKRQGRTGGRPPKLTEDDLEAARAMLANPTSA
jgi:DNA invertase Pin-like site-specific DNA recombinase